MSNEYVSYEYFKLKDGVFPTEEWNGEISTHLDFKDVFNHNHQNKLIETDAVLSGVSTPVDRKAKLYTCPQCWGHDYIETEVLEKVSSTVLVRGWDYASKRMDVCPFCSEEADDGKLYLNNPSCLVMEMRISDVFYSIQQLKFEHPDTMRTLIIGYVGDMEFTKRDIGKGYTIKGVVKEVASRKYPYVIHTDDLLLIENNKDMQKSSFTDSRDIPGYGEWREHILARDKVCVVCGGDKNLHAHHLFGYKENPSLRVHTENGVAVCQWCHDKYHSYYGVKQINPVDFIKFVHRFGVK